MRPLSWTFALVVAACTYQPSTLELSGPVAVIGDGSGEYRVGAGVRVFLDGTRSHDPEGGELTFAWNVGPGCTNEAPDELAQPVIAFVSAAPGSTCEVSLTVTNEAARTDTATATVNVVVGGAYVATSDCVEAGDPPVWLGKGTRSSPWCSPEDAVAAAGVFHLADVWITAEDFAIEQALVLPAGVSVHGGLEPVSWAPLDVHTNLGLRGDANVRLQPGVGARLEWLAVHRAEPCTGDECNLVSLRRASATIDHCLIGAARDGVTGLTTGSPSDGAIARSLHVVGGAAATHVEVIDSQILLPYQIGQGYGIVLDGRGGDLSAEINNTSVTGDNDTWTVAAVRTVATRDVVLRGCLIDHNALFDGTHHAFGVLDGIGDAIVPERMDLPCAEETCFGSRALEIIDTHINVTAVTNAAAVALFGSEQPAIRSTRTSTDAISAISGRTAIGVWSVSTEGLAVQGKANEHPVTLVALSERDIGDVIGGAFGLLDGVAAFNAAGELTGYTGDSDDLSIDGASITALVDSRRSEPVVAAGAMLAGTTASVVARSGFVAATESASQPLVAVGLWTVATEGVRVLDNHWWPVDPLRTAANDFVAAYVDGWPDRPLMGSSDLQFTGNDLAIDLLGNDMEWESACVLMSATFDSLVGDNRLACTSSSTDPAVLHELLVMDTSGLAIEHNTITWTRPYATHNPAPVIGIRDGMVGEANEMLARGSSELTIAGNTVFASSSDTFGSSTGIWLDHHAPNVTRRVSIENNTVHGVGVVEFSRAIRLHNANADVFNNTISGGPCDAIDIGSGFCDGPQLALGIEVAGAADEAAEVSVANNLIDPGEGRFTYAIVDHAAELSGVDVVGSSLAVFHSNALVAAPDPALIERQCYYFSEEDSGVIGCAANETQVSDISNIDVIFLSDPPLCADRIHLDPLHSNLSALEDQGDETYAPLDDIDGHGRVDGSPDIGADEVDGTVCGGYS